MDFYPTRSAHPSQAYHREYQGPAVQVNDLVLGFEVVVVAPRDPGFPAGKHVLKIRK